MRERVKKPCAEIAVTMGASLKPMKGPLSPRQKLVGRLAVGVLALYLVTAATAASSPRGNRLVYQEGDMRSFARSSRGAPAMAAAPEMMMMAEDAACLLYTSDAADE